MGKSKKEPKGKEAAPAEAVKGDKGEDVQEVEGEKPHHKKAIELSRKTGKSHRTDWSSSYDKGFEDAHHAAVTRIQRAFRRYKAWKKANDNKAEILRLREKLSGKDHLGRLLLFLFNLGGIVLGVCGAIGVWYYLINCPKYKGGWIDVGPQLCANTIANSVLFWTQLVFSALCFVGARSTRKDRLSWLRAYSFFLLLNVGGQLSIVGMFMLDNSAAVAGMKEDTFISLRNQVCTLDTVFADVGATGIGSALSDGVHAVGSAAIDGVGDLTGLSNSTVAPAGNSSTNGTDDSVRAWLGVDALCSCNRTGADALKLPQECVRDWLDLRMDKMMTVFGGFIFLQVLMAHFAWRFLGLPSGAGTNEGEVTQLKLWLESNELGMYTKQFMMRSIRSKEKLLELKLNQVMEIGMSLTDTRNFLVAQSDSKVQELDQQDSLGLTGWDKLMMSAVGLDPTDDLNLNVKIMTKTFYFEFTVLASVGLCMWVLAHDSRTFPPSDDLAVVMASAQMFVTIFLTLEMTLELVLSVTSRHALRKYFEDPWHILDLFVLLVFWLYQFYPGFRGWFVHLVPASAAHLPEVTPGILSVLRALRVLRPLRTLRLLGDITLVAQCITSAAGLFRDAMFFVIFLITLFSMIGTSSFSGALHYTCVRCGDAGHNNPDIATAAKLNLCPLTDRRVYLGTAQTSGEANWMRADAEDIAAHWLTNETLLDCPSSLTCVKNARLDGTFIRCIERDILEVGEDGYGTRSFDNFFAGFYTMFILMTGDNGMQDIPNAMFTVDASSNWLAWPVFFAASFALTLVALNLFLAICCSVFEDIHAALEHAKEKRESAKEVQAQIQKLDEVYNKEQQELADMDGVEKEDENILLQMDEALETVIEGAGKAVFDLADGLKGALLDKPSIGLEDMDEERAEMDRLIKERSEKSGAVAQMVTKVGRSAMFEILVMLMIVAYTLSVMNQESADDGIDPTWVNVELCVMVFFVMEAMMMIGGLGFKNYLSYGENRLDFIILLCTIAGHVATHQMAKYAAAMDLKASAMAEATALKSNALATLTIDYGTTDNSTLFSNSSTAEGVLPFDLPGFDTSGETGLRILKLFRILQMFRMTYKYTTMRDILTTVFKTASTIAYLIIFVIFVLCMFSLIMMHLISGGCDEKYNPNVQALWPDETCSYPDRNFESFEIGFFTSFQVMIGEDWSETMFWYYIYSPIGWWSAPLLMAMWFVVHGVLFSLFVAVLLLNFGMDEEEKMPMQKDQYDAYQKKKKNASHLSLADAQAVDRYEREEGKSVGGGAEVELTVLLDEEAGKVGTGPRLGHHKSLFIFFLNHPVRMFCATVEQHVYFEVAMILLIFLSCISVAAEGPVCGENKDILEAATATMAMGDEDGDGSESMTLECPENELAFFFHGVGYAVLGAFIVELILRSISGGFVLKSGPSRSYLQNKQNLLDFVIILVIIGTHTVDLWMPKSDDHRVSVNLVRAMAPMFSLVRNRPLRKIARAFGNALPLVATVSVPITFLMMMMSVVGVDLFGHGQFKQCQATGNMISFLNGEPYAEFNQTQCVQLAATGEDVEWSNPPFNFDDAFAGLITLFKSSTAGVNPMANVAMNVAGTGQPPEGSSCTKITREDGTIYSVWEADSAYLWTTISFFTTFHVIFTFFLMNLFIGVMSVSFSKSTGTIMITSLQRRWTQCHTMVNNFKPHDDINEEYRPLPGEPLFHVRLTFFTVVTNDYFNTFVMGIIASNCVVLLLEHYPAEPEWAQMIGYIDIAFLFFYMVEMLAKMIGLGLGNYFSSSGWNTFDFFLISTSLATAIVGTVSGIEGLRALRSLRLFLLVRQLPGLMSLIDTVIHCLPPSLTIGTIMMVFFYLYSIIGMRVFGNTIIEHQGGFYDANNNFDSFPNAFKLLAQVLFGQNYMWLTADLVSEGHEEQTVFLYFGSFFVINVLININLFAVVVLDNFAAQNPVMQTIQPVDLWSFTHCWAEQTIGAAACTSLQKGKAAQMLKHFETKEAANEAADDEYDVCGTTGQVLDKDGTTVTGHKALQFKARLQRKRPKGVVEINVVDFKGLRIRDKGDQFEGAKPRVQLFSKPNGRSHPHHTAVQQKVQHHGDNQKVEFGDGKGEKFEIYINERALNVTFEVIDSRDNSKIAQAALTAEVISKHTNSADPEHLFINLTGPRKRLDEATPDELEAYYNSQNDGKSPRKEPSEDEAPPELSKKEQKATDKAVKKAEKEEQKAAKQAEKAAAKAAKLAVEKEARVIVPKIPMFFPVVGQLHIEVVFKPGLALPTFDFMSDYNDNQEFKEEGSGLEGWVWKKSDDMHSKWERRWMWLSTIKTLPKKDQHPEMYFTVPKDFRAMKVTQLEGDVATSKAYLDQMTGIPEKKKDKKIRRGIQDEEHKLVTLKNALFAAVQAKEEAAVPIGYYSAHPGNSALEDSVPVFGWRAPDVSFWLGPEEQREVGVYYYKEVDDEGELEDRGRGGDGEGKHKLKANFVPASQIIEVLDHIPGSNTATATHFGHTDHDATRLLDSEFCFKRREHHNGEGNHRKESVYKCRAMSPQQKIGWVASLKWLASGSMTKNGNNNHEYYSIEGDRPGLLAHPPLNDRDLIRVKNNPALLPLPFCRLRHLLTSTIYRSSSLGNHRLTREWIMYVMFNLEMKCLQELDEEKGDTRRAHIGEYIAELRGLDYHKTLNQLCLLHYAKRHSLMYPQQVEEYMHDLRKVALNMITCAVSGWIHGKALPKFHEKKYGDKMQNPRAIESQDEKNVRKKGDKKKKKEKKQEQTVVGDEPEVVDDGVQRCNTYPKHPLWRKRPAAHSVAAIGVAASRLESLKVLFRAIKKEKPALLTQQENEERAEKERKEALSEDAREEEEREKAHKEREKAEKEVNSLTNRGKGCFKRGGDDDEGAGFKIGDVKSQFTNPMQMMDDSDDEADGEDGGTTSKNPMVDTNADAGGAVAVASKKPAGGGEVVVVVEEPAFEPKRYCTLNRGVYREGWDKHTPQCGEFWKGVVVVVLEERGKRVRTEDGWMSKIAENEMVLLEEIDHNGDEHTLSMFDDSQEISNGGDASPATSVEFENPMVGNIDSDESPERSESDSDDEGARDESGKTRRERRADKAYAALFVKFDTEGKGYLDREQTVELLKTHYASTMKASQMSAKKYVKKNFELMCTMTPTGPTWDANDVEKVADSAPDVSGVEEVTDSAPDASDVKEVTGPPLADLSSAVAPTGLDVENWRCWDASEEVVSLRLERPKVKKKMTKEELYRKQHQSTAEEEARIQREMFASESAE